MSWNEFYRNFHNIDYLLFGVGFAFIILGLLLFIFFQQKKQWFKETYYLLFDVFIIAIGLVAWFELIMIVFGEQYFLERLRYLLFIIAFLSLFEFGKRSIIGEKYRFLYVGYLISLLIVIKITNFSIIYYYAFISMLFAGIGLRVRFKKENLNLKPYKLMNALLISFSFVLLIVVSFNFAEIVAYLEYLYVVIQILIWLYTSISIVLITRIYLSYANNDPLEYQIRKIRVKLVKLTVIAILVVFIAGFFIVNYQGQKQYTIEKEHILYGIDIATISLDGKDIQIPIISSIQYERFRGISIIFILFLILLSIIGIHFIRLRERAWRSNQLTILSSIEDIVGIFEKEGKILYANKAAYKLVEPSSKNIHDYTLYDFFNEKDTVKLRNIINSFTEDKTVYAELNLIDSKGIKIPIYCSISYLDYEHTDALFIFTALDRSEQKKREEEMHAHYQNTLSLLATVVDAKDGYTARHSINVAKYAKAIANELNLGDEIVKEVETAALVHDIGKIGIHDSMLKKEGPLTDNEWDDMRKHPEYGKLILEKAGETFTKYIPYVYHHHERYDGKGYPTGMKEPSLLISIISVADALDAMISDRSYRKGMPLEIAKNELIKQAGTQFHPQAVEAIVSIIEREGDNLLK